MTCLICKREESTQFTSMKLFWWAKMLWANTVGGVGESLQPGWCLSYTEVAPAGSVHVYTGSAVYMQSPNLECWLASTTDTASQPKLNIGWLASTHLAWAIYQSYPALKTVNTHWSCLGIDSVFRTTTSSPTVFAKAKQAFQLLLQENAQMRKSQQPGHFTPRSWGILTLWESA